MDNPSIERRFQSIFYVLIHFSFSLLELTCIFGILASQILLTVNDTCAYQVAAGFWSLPFLFLGPISIWILLWKRNVFSCFLLMICHICSTLFSTVVILISFLVLIGILGNSCSKTNEYFNPLNISLIVIAFTLKLFLYIEMIFIYLLHRHSKQMNKSDDLLIQQQQQQANYRVNQQDLSTDKWAPFRSIIQRSQNYITDLDV